MRFHGLILVLLGLNAAGAFADSCSSQPCMEDIANSWYSKPDEIQPSNIEQCIRQSSADPTRVEFPPAQLSELTKSLESLINQQQMEFELDGKFLNFESLYYSKSESENLAQMSFPLRSSFYLQQKAIRRLAAQSTLLNISLDSALLERCLNSSAIDPLRKHIRDSLRTEEHDNISDSEVTTILSELDVFSRSSGILIDNRGLIETETGYYKLNSDLYKLIPFGDNLDESTEIPRGKACPSKFYDAHSLFSKNQNDGSEPALCSGTLLNISFDSSNQGSIYVLTAEHCKKQQTRSAFVFEIANFKDGGSISSRNICRQDCGRALLKSTNRAEADWALIPMECSEYRTGFSVTRPFDKFKSDHSGFTVGSPLGMETTIFGPVRINRDSNAPKFFGDAFNMNHMSGSALIQFIKNSENLYETHIVGVLSNATRFSPLSIEHPDEENKELCIVPPVCCTDSCFESGKCSDNECKMNAEFTRTTVINSRLEER